MGKGMRAGRKPSAGKAGNMQKQLAQVQAMLGISRHLAYALIGDGDIPGMKIGNAYRVPKINVIRYALSAGNPQPAA